MNSDRKYSFMVENNDVEMTIRGVTDHVIKLRNSGYAAMTLEDKNVCMALTDQEVCQVVTQVRYEVENMEKGLRYVPSEYVGLLQNGPVWIAVRRRVVCGYVLWSYVRTGPAFTIHEDCEGKRCASPIVDDHCVEIARLIEHAYCVADKIMDEIFFPEKRQINILNSIHEYRNLDDDGDDDDNDEDEEESKSPDVPGESGGTATVAVATVAPIRRSTRQQGKSGGGENYADSSHTCVTFDSSQNNDYFVLPLTSSNVARHTLKCVESGFTARGRGNLCA